MRGHTCEFSSMQECQASSPRNIAHQIQIKLWLEAEKWKSKKAKYWTYLPKIKYWAAEKNYWYKHSKNTSFWQECVINLALNKFMHDPHVLCLFLSINIHLNKRVFEWSDVFERRERKNFLFQRRVLELVEPLNPQLILCYIVEGLKGHPQHFLVLWGSQSTQQQRIWHNSLEYNHISLECHWLKQFQVEGQFTNSNLFSAIRYFSLLSHLIRSHLEKGTTMCNMPTWIHWPFAVFSIDTNISCTITQTTAQLNHNPIQLCLYPDVFLSQKWSYLSESD